MADVSKKLIGQFAGNLEQVIAARQVTATAAAATEAPGEGGEAVATAPAPAAAPVLNNEALDLGNAAMVPVLKRVIPAVIVVAVVVGVIIWAVNR